MEPRLRLLLDLIEDFQAAGLTHVPRAQPQGAVSLATQPRAQPASTASRGNAAAGPRAVPGAQAGNPRGEPGIQTAAGQGASPGPAPRVVPVAGAAGASGSAAQDLTGAPPARVSARSPQAAAPSLLPLEAGGEPSPQPLGRQERIAALAVLADEVRACTRCTVLAAQRTQTVFGVGNVEPRVVFFGEAPGADEDRQGEPFVGRAGQLLNKMLEACGFRREDVYIMNVLKCRPPENRTPAADEVENCRPFFERQLEILHPEYICCLGGSAAGALLGNRLALGRLRGRFHTWRGIKVLCTYHPAYLLRNPEAKRDAWEDLKLLLRDMGLVPPALQGRSGT